MHAWSYKQCKLKCKRNLPKKETEMQPRRKLNALFKTKLKQKLPKLPLKIYTKKKKGHQTPNTITNSPMLESHIALDVGIS